MHGNPPLVSLMNQVLFTPSQFGESEQVVPAGSPKDLIH